MGPLVQSGCKPIQSGYCRPGSDREERQPDAAVFAVHNPWLTRPHRCRPTRPGPSSPRREGTHGHDSPAELTAARCSPMAAGKADTLSRGSAATAHSQGPPHRPAASRCRARRRQGRHSAPIASIAPRIPVRCSCRQHQRPGRAARGKDDMRDRRLGRVVTVVDRESPAGIRRGCGRSPTGVRRRCPRTTSCVAPCTT